MPGLPAFSFPSGGSVKKPKLRKDRLVTFILWCRVFSSEIKFVTMIAALIIAIVGAVLLAIFAIDLGWTTHGAPLALTPAGVREVFTSSRGIHVMIDLAGLAIAGGLYIVPTFAAVQAWAGADRRVPVAQATAIVQHAAAVTSLIGCTA